MNIKRQILLLGVVIMTSISQNGCASSVPPYSTVIRNVGLIKFSDAMIIFNKRKLIAGWVTPGNHKVNVNPSAPIPDKAIVSWQREGGKVYEKEIEIKSKLQKLTNKQEYYLIVDINDNDEVNFKVIICSPEEKCLDKW